jgi:hypothetical protein
VHFGCINVTLQEAEDGPGNKIRGQTLQQWRFDLSVWFGQWHNESSALVDGVYSWYAYCLLCSTCTKFLTLLLKPPYCQLNMLVAAYARVLVC